MSAADEPSIRETRPTVEGFREMLADRGLELPDDKVEAAVQMHARFRHELDRLRSVKLRYLPPYIEPATATQWIENGGRSVDRLGEPDVSMTAERASQSGTE